MRRTVYLIFFLFICVSCKLNSNDNKFRIYTDTEIVDYNSDIMVNIEDNFDSNKVDWYVNEKIVSTHDTLVLNSGFEERKLYIYAKSIIDGESYKSNVCEIIVTSNSKLFFKLDEFIKKNNISTPISVGIKNSNYEYFFSSNSLIEGLKHTKNEEDLYITYSITKSFTTMAVLYLEKSNYFSLGDKITTYIEIPENLFINRDATIKDLLQHTSGNQDYVKNMSLYYNNPFINSVWDPNALLRYIQSPPLEIGTFVYSSTNYILLGLLIEKVTGKNLNMVFREFFFDSLSLKNTFLLPQDNVNMKNILHPHVYPYTDFLLTGDGLSPIDITLIIPNFIIIAGKSSWASGGIVSTARDITNWCHELFNGNILDNELKIDILNSLENNVRDSESIYGYGVRKIFYKDTSFVGSYGRGLGTVNCMFYNDDTKTSFVILMSSNSSSDGNPNIDELLFLLYETVTCEA